ncbi:MAG: methionine--tRNA ligase [Holosporales bacterium]|nr:methionine--tRNA ligase [Holosporales bacterium]
MSLSPRYVTTPIYYLNGPPHLGHAYTTIAADFMARFWRLEGRKCYFLTGSDEYGQKIAAAAAAQNLSPQVYVDQMVLPFQEMVRRLGATANDFLRTTEARHQSGAQAFWRQLQEAGFIYRGTYSGWYAVTDEAYYSEEDIKDGKAPTGAPVTWMEEVCYFFKLSAFQEPLLRFYEENPNFIAPSSRYNEVKRWVERGLQDLAISRSHFSWGIPVPGDQEHVMYVWVEALSNYITALGYPDEKTDLFKTFWPEALHLLGKDILRFHGVYWPAFLMALGLPLPRKIFAHGWWTNKEQKMSKSVGNVVDPFRLVEEYGLDPLRYFLLREISFGGDGDFSEKALVGRLNADLANDLGNLVQRVLGFIHKHLQGKMPESFPETALPQGTHLRIWGEELYPKLQNCIEAQALSKYLEIVWEGIALGNQFVDLLKPWVLVKSERVEDHHILQEGMATLCETLRIIGIFILPAMPQSGEGVLKQLGLLLRSPWTLSEIPSLKTHAAFPPPSPLFPRRDVSP